MWLSKIKELVEALWLVVVTVGKLAYVILTTALPVIFLMLGLLVNLMPFVETLVDLAIDRSDEFTAVMGGAFDAIVLVNQLGFPAEFAASMAFVDMYVPVGVVLAQVASLLGVWVVATAVRSVHNLFFS